MIQFKPSNLDKLKPNMNTRTPITIKNATIALTSALFVYAVWTVVENKLDESVVTTPAVAVVQSKEEPRDANGLTADMRHNMQVCAKVGMYYLSGLTVLGFKAECLTKFEYDRRIEIIDKYIANSQLKELR